MFLLVFSDLDFEYLKISQQTATANASIAPGRFSSRDAEEGTRQNHLTGYSSTQRGTGPPRAVCRGSEPYLSFVLLPRREYHDSQFYANPESSRAAKK